MRFKKYAISSYLTLFIRGKNSRGYGNVILGRLDTYIFMFGFQWLHLCGYEGI